MTYCLGIKTKAGLIALADTRITTGTDTSVKVKILTMRHDTFPLFVMTSGLRSIRDKAVVYFKEVMEQQQFTNVYKAVNAFGQQVRRVADEDQKALEKSGFKFDLHTIIGGQFGSDDEHRLFLLYPEGNWVELGHGAPYVVIGNSGHGKAILNRVLNENSTLRDALKAGFLSFDSTRLSASNVDFPIDVVVYQKNSFVMVENRYEQKDLARISDQWDQQLKQALASISDDWMDAIFNQLPA
jgi:putative proteasome-type protease